VKNVIITLKIPDAAIVRSSLLPEGIVRLTAAVNPLQAADDSAAPIEYTIFVKESWVTRISMEDSND
jgi:hypothetical protein